MTQHTGAFHLGNHPALSYWVSRFLPLGYRGRAERQLRLSLERLQLSLLFPLHLNTLMLVLPLKPCARLPGEVQVVCKVPCRPHELGPLSTNVSRPYGPVPNQPVLRVRLSEFCFVAKPNEQAMDWLSAP